MGGGKPGLEVRDEAEAPSAAACRGRRAGRGPGRPGRPGRAASSTSATRWRSLAWTPPGPIRLTTWRRPSGCAARVAGLDERRARRRTSRRAIAASIRGRSWSTGRPAPRLRCPTSELPIWPGGQADRVLRRAEDRVGPASRAGRARSASGVPRWHPSAGSPPIPNPSRTTRTIGRGRSPGHAVTAAAGALRPSGPARATMPAISSGLSEAPPTSAPSIEGSAGTRRCSPKSRCRRTGSGRHRGSRPPAEPGEGGPDRVGHRGRVRARSRSGRCRSPRPARRR